MRTLAVLLLAAAVGCQSTVKAPIRVKVASAIDLQKHRSFAALPFVDESGRLPDAVLEEMTEMTRERIGRSADASVVSGAVTRSLMAGEELNAGDWTDPDKARAWADLFEVDALIAAQASYDTILDVQHQPVDRYSYAQQRIITEVETRIVRSHYFKLDIAVIDSESGEPIFRQSLTERYREPHNALTAIASEAFSSTETASQLGRRAVLKFIRAIAPHYEIEERTLAR